MAPPAIDLEFPSKTEFPIYESLISIITIHDPNSLQELLINSTLSIYKIGWNKLNQYDELILANDSCFAPMFPLKDIFKKADKSNCDFWHLNF